MKYSPHLLQHKVRYVFLDLIRVCGVTYLTSLLLATVHD